MSNDSNSDEYHHENTYKKRTSLSIESNDWIKNKSSSFIIYFPLLFLLIITLELYH